MPTIKYPKNPNTDTAFVEQDDGTKNRALMTAPQDISTLELPNNPNSTKGYVTVDGKKQRVILTADIGGGGGSSLPDQTGHSGEFLTTDGTDASWGSVSEVPSTTGATEGDVLTVDSNGDPAWTTPSGGGLPDQTGQSGKFLTTDGTDTSWSSLVGTAPTTNNITRKLLVTDGSAIESWSDGFTVNYNTFNSNGFINLSKNTQVPYKGVVIGFNAQVDGLTGQVVIGAAAVSSGAAYGVAVGHNAGIGAQGAIQISSSNLTATQTNSDANTFKVANANGNFEIMSADGTIPTDRFTTTPSADGTYVPTLTISSGVATRTWGSGGGGGLQNTATGTESLGILNDQSGNYNTVVGVKDTSFSSSVNGATTLGYKAVVSSSEGAVAIGRQAKVGANNTSDGGIAIGYLASTTYGGLSSTNAICIGKSSHATGSRSLAIGSQAVSGAAGAIQLGGTSTSSATTNSDANTFKVANANGNFEMMNANGNLPADRLASTTGLADGNYRLRLVMASGVPTLEWVAE